MLGLGAKTWREEKPGIPSCEWEDNIKMNFTVVGLEVEDWIYPSWNKDKWWTAWQNKWAFGLHKMWEIPWADEELLACHEGELVI